jgi:hypothetical protein
MAWTAARTWVSGELVTASIMNTYIRDNQNILKTPITDTGQLEFVDATELTIASGVITVTQNYHKIDTEGAGASDDLDTITAGASVTAGFILHLRVESDARTVVLKNGTSGSDNLDLGADITLDESYKTYSLVYDGTNWRPLSYVSTTTPTFASLSPLTTRGDTLVATSGTVTGTRLAVGGYGTALKSDGTDAAWDAGYKDLTVTLADCSNTTSKTAIITTESIPADQWTIGSFFSMEISAAMVNGTGSSQTITYEFDFGDGSQTQTKVWEAQASVRYQLWRLIWMRKDSDELIYPYPGINYKHGWNPGDGNDLRMTVTNFDSASTFTVEITFPTASSTLYISPQAGQCRFYKKG